MIKVPKIIKLLFFNQVWDIPNSENTIYLTFDDGPTPEITERVLEILDKRLLSVALVPNRKSTEHWFRQFKKIRK